MANIVTTSRTHDLESLNKVLDMNILTQDEQQMVHIVKRHYYENGLIFNQQAKNIAIIARNTQNVQILCQGDAAYEQDLTRQLNEANSTLQRLRDRLAPKDTLVSKLRQIVKDAEKFTAMQQTEEMLLHRIQNKIEVYQAKYAEEQAEVDKWSENMKFKEEVHKHLKKNLQSRRQMITRVKATMEELTQKFVKDSQDHQLEKQRKMQQIDRLSMSLNRFRQQLTEVEARYQQEKTKYHEHVKDWRERTRQATQRKNDVYETLQKGEMEKRLLQSQMQRHTEKHSVIFKRADDVAKELESTKSEIEETKKKIAEYAAVPESHQATMRILQGENSHLKLEIDQMTKDVKEAKEQAQKLKQEYTELESMDAKGRRQKMEKQQKALRESLEKIDGAVLAAESSYTCFECLKLVKSPMTFVPCGHSVCRDHGKHTDDMLICPECKYSCETVFSNSNIPELLSKLQFLHSLISTAIEN